MAWYQRIANVFRQDLAPQAARRAIHGSSSG